MKIMTRVFVFTVAAFLLVFGPAAMAQANGAVNLSHFKFYSLETHEPPIVQFYLNDQFGPSDLLTAQGPKALGLPTMKNDEPIIDEFAHLTMYSFFEPQPGRRVVYENQFGENVVSVRDAIYMFTPALKFPQPGEELPINLDHFKCYDAVGPPLNIPVRLQTQFGEEFVEVLAPQLFCNPAEKLLPDGNVYPIQNPHDHLVCYEILPHEPLEAPVVVKDQFIETDGLLRENIWLCVPSLKTGVTQVETPTWGKLKAIYR